jgi:hypothetical protein
MPPEDPHECIYCAITRLRAERDELRALIREHNDGLRQACGLGDDEGVRCGYRPYFPRRCPECPVQWSIDYAQRAESTPVSSTGNEEKQSVPRHVLLIFPRADAATEEHGDG